MVPGQKILIAVHGIGDQFNFATIQSVAHRVCDYVGQPAAMPLAHFTEPLRRSRGPTFPTPDRDPHVNCGFAEIYWADVPRKPAAEKYILEEPTNWARTLVERLELRSARALEIHPCRQGAGSPRHRTGPASTRRDDPGSRCRRSRTIPGGRAGFNLKKLLIDYLNDVQVVTEFDNYREELLDIFPRVVETTNEFFPEADLYIIAHSEEQLSLLWASSKGYRAARSGPSGSRG